MNSLLYYLALPLIYLVSLSPFWLLYRISDFLYVVIYYLVGYRKKVVIENLKNAFPDKPESEIKLIAKKFYQHLCDLLVESIKTITMSERYVQRHLKFHHSKDLDKIFDKGKSIIIVMGHFGNWEFGGPSFSLNCKHQLKVIYQVLSNPDFEKLFSTARTKFGTRIVPRKNMLRSMVADKKELTATALIADQVPSNVISGNWLRFLNQDTLVHIGPEKVAKMFNYPVVYIHIDKAKRGYYEITPTILFENPKETENFEITTAFFSRLEAEIKKKPEIWLWSHRRWKHKLNTNGDYSFERDNTNTGKEKIRKRTDQGELTLRGRE